MATLDYQDCSPDDTSDDARDLCAKCYAFSALYKPSYAFNTHSKEYLCKECWETPRHSAAATSGGVCKYHGQNRDEFCFNHFRSVCAICHREQHKHCKVKPLSAVSCTDHSELKALKDGVKKFRIDASEAMAKKIVEIQVQRKVTIDALKISYDKMLSIVSQSEENAKQHTNDKYNEMVQTTGTIWSTTGEYLNEFENMLLAIGEPESYIHATRHSKAIPIIIHRIEEYSNTLFESTTEDITSSCVAMFESRVCQFLLQMQQHHKREDMLHVPSDHLKTVPEISLATLPPRFETMLSVKDNQTKQNMVKVLKQNARIHMLEAYREESFNVKFEDDTDDCCITGLSVTDEGKILMVDCYNRKVKYLSAEGELISSILVPGEPFDISIVGKSEAVVTMWENQKKILIISFNNEDLDLKSIICLRNRVLGIASVENDFAVSCDDTNPGVMLIDRAGKTKWHQYFKEGRRLFKAPGYIITLLIKDVPHVIVSDKDLHTLTVIEAKTGEVVKVCYLSKTGPYGLTSWHGNVIVSYCYSAGVCIWTPDLSEHRVLLSIRNSIKRPHAIAFNPLTNDLLLSSWRCNTMERFKIS